MMFPFLATKISGSKGNFTVANPEQKSNVTQIFEWEIFGVFIKLIKSSTSKTILAIFQTLLNPKHTL